MSNVETTRTRIAPAFVAPFAIFLNNFFQWWGKGGVRTTFVVGVAVPVRVVFFRCCRVSFAFDMYIRPFLGGNEMEETRTQMTPEFRTHLT